MSISILWRPVKNDGKSLFGTSGQYGALVDIFGSRGVIRNSDAPMLRAMHRVLGQERSLFGDLVDVLENETEIVVWAEY